MAVFSFVFLVLFASLAFGQAPVDGGEKPFVIGATSEEIRDVINQQGLCMDLQATRLCRGLPWPARVHEGVATVQGMAVIMIKDVPSEKSAMAGWVRKLPEGQKWEYYALLYLVSPGVIKSLGQSGYTSVLLMLMHDSDPSKVRMALFSSRGSLLEFGAAKGELWRKEVSEAIDHWLPPVESEPFYQVRYF